ncbi:hypothetical protein LPB03_08395 [Polaribacter vadi]|uniref:LTD domain-containing protein n=1 Tax=Polaribacter vadi TaxID=1774273 RepID=A0A1B8U2Q7_9FLAO|nr:T9SS type A sorting domain-containing protein [Polaribacter vadi]AOW17483.1 hypothetical protein LPB03_08395 [Polaribacter vadi]OBY66174.1 hypothetical protein LPB3_01780 [Polaribacter vadi]
MKKNYIFTLLITLCFSAFSFGQTTLAPGDIVIIEMQGDAPDGFRFVPLVDLEAGTTIRFTDNGWMATALRTSEGTVLYTAPAGGVAKGTNIRYTVGGTTDFTLDGNDLNIASSGDQILAYQGDTASPTFIFAASGSSTVWHTDTNDSNQTDLPTGLTDGVNAVTLGAGDGPESEFDNIYYSGITTGSKASLLAAVSTASNWTGENDGSKLNPITTNFTITTSTAPSLSISSPINNNVYDATVTDIPVNLVVENFTLSGDNGSEESDNSGDGYILGVLSENGVIDGSKNIFSTSETIDNVVPGTIYIITAELVDNDGNSLSPKVETTTTFSVAFPCSIEIGSILTTCNTETTSSDTYDISIPFTGGNTSTYVLTADSGTIGGDDPSTTASGTITISNVTEATDVVFTLIGDVANSTCNLSRNISSPTCLPAPTCPEIGDLIITEIMQNPNAVGDEFGEYFEVYNTTGAPIDMQGWMIKSLTVSSKDHVIENSLIVPANGYVTLGIDSNIATNGGVIVDYQYGSNFFLGNSSDSVALDCGSSIIDAVSWDNGATFPDPTGKSMELAVSKYSATDNDNGANWGEATQEIIKDGDLGTPGAANTFTLSIVKNQIEGFAIYPNPVTNNTFTITTNSTDKKEVKMFNVLGKQVFATSFSDTKSTIDIPAISAGLYILKVTEGTRTATSKLVIK